MSNYTTTKKDRLFERVSTDFGFDIVRREHPLPAVANEKKNCPVCRLPMFVSPGQHMRMHRDCKQDYKLKLKYGGK